VLHGLRLRPGREIEYPKAGIPRQPATDMNWLAAAMRMAFGGIE
jgi:hypothetical protein